MGPGFCVVEVSVQEERMIKEKGVEHYIFKERAMGQGVKPSLARFAVSENKIPRHGEHLGSDPKLRMLEAPVADHKGSSDKQLLLALATEKDGFFIHIWKLHEVSLKLFYCLCKVRNRFNNHRKDH